MMKGSQRSGIEKRIIRKLHEQTVFDLKRGFLQFAVLTLINQKPKYTYEIKADILKITMGGFDIDRNNLYKKLRSLERDGIVKSHEVPSPKGAKRKYYSITPLGKKLLKITCDYLEHLMLPLRKSIKV